MNSPEKKSPQASLQNSLQTRPESSTKIRRALLSVSDKSGLLELGRALHESGTELFASGGTLKTLAQAGIPAREATELSGSPEAFDGRMKTLSFPIFSGILSRRDREEDLNEMQRLSLRPIDAVVVNFYPFEKVKSEASREERIELIDIGGPALVRAAAKNSPDVLVLTDPAQYGSVIQELSETGAVTHATAEKCRARAWTRVLEYDRAIEAAFGENPSLTLRYGENPHQQATVTVEKNAPLRWNAPLTEAALSYNNLLDFSAAYSLVRDLKALHPKHASCVIVKHNNPCGVASVPVSVTDDAASALNEAFALAWAGDPISAFGGIVVLSHPLTEEISTTLAGRFIEGLAAPKLHSESPELLTLLKKRKGLKALAIEHFEEGTEARMMQVTIPGGTLTQTEDRNVGEELEIVTGEAAWADEKKSLAQFGILVCRSLKSNAIAIVHSPSPHTFQLVGAGQGQPNRIDALSLLAIPRAKKTLEESGAGSAKLAECILISDAFFPFRDSIEAAARDGIRSIVQPGGSIRDEDVRLAARELGLEMAFTGMRHFRH